MFNFEELKFYDIYTNRHNQIYANSNTRKLVKNDFPPDVKHWLPYTGYILCTLNIICLQYVRFMSILIDISVDDICVYTGIPLQHKLVA